jgi:hypothetical protein
VAQLITRLTAKKKITGSSPARIEIIYFSMAWKETNKLKKRDHMFKRSCGAMDNASDYESEDCRFESCQDRFLWFDSHRSEKQDAHLHQLLIENLKVTINSPVQKEGWRFFLQNYQMLEKRKQ